DEADYVIAIGHCGTEPRIDYYKSSDIIANTTGLTAFIDGHSHYVMPGDTVEDKEGRPVVLTQTGCYLKNIGLMHISDGRVTTELISEYETEDDTVRERMNQLDTTVEDQLGRTVAVLDNKQYIMSPEDPNVRIVRNHNTNSSDLCADAIYWYFNEYMDMDCDAAIVNSGGIRSDVEAGSFSYLSAKQLHPFGNVLCMVEIDGQTLLDVLEFGANKTPGESGRFMKAAGLVYTIDTNIESTAAYDAEDSFVAPPTGEYRVKDVKIYNRETGSYEPLEADRKYKVGGQNYILRNGGSGMSMLLDSEVVTDYVTEDYLALAAYAQAFRQGEDGMPHINNANAPAADYSGYIYDYEDPYGSDRIIIKTE
ncbi:MAG: 5'-nucleotidase C-terminal domain-containing protein, partial [Parasporobacterium sp.]|nr:5'-nucleotidase C-terminal domain-containing protein [Parasporobacterium sp.]